MDIVTIAGVLTAVSAAGIAGVIWGRGTVEEIPLQQLETTTSNPVAVINGHVHECNHYEEDTLGWRCYVCWRNGVYTPMERGANNRG